MNSLALRGGKVLCVVGVVSAVLLLPGGIPLLAWALYRRRSELPRLVRRWRLGPERGGQE